jgi:hypothetical protein
MQGCYGGKVDLQEGAAGVKSLPPEQIPPTVALL